MLLRERSEVAFGRGNIAVAEVLRDFLDGGSNVFKESRIAVSGRISGHLNRQP